MAAANGLVHLSDIFPGFYNAQAYNTIEIEHSYGYRTYYLHLNRQFVAEGQRVVKGQLIGLSGNVGTSAYYLHFEVQRNGVPVDPYGWEGKGTDLTQNQSIIISGNQKGSLSKVASANTQKLDKTYTAKKI